MRRKRFIRFKRGSLLGGLLLFYDLAPPPQIGRQCSLPSRETPQGSASGVFFVSQSVVRTSVYNLGLKIEGVKETT
jgi:hypothetical protein